MADILINVSVSVYDNETFFDKDIVPQFTIVTVIDGFASAPSHPLLIEELAKLGVPDHGIAMILNNVNEALAEAALERVQQEAREAQESREGWVPHGDR